MDESKPVRISDEKAALVLDRAAKLDAVRGREVDVAELRDAALEAGISAEAFERALAEVENFGVQLAALAPRPRHPAVPEAESEPPRSTTATFLRGGALLALGLAIGGLTIGLEAMFGDGGIAFGLLIALFAAIAMLVQRTRERSMVGFLLDLFVFWIGLTFMLMLTDPSDAEDIVALMSFWGGAAGALGTGAIALAGLRKKPEALPEET